MEYNTINLSEPVGTLSVVQRRPEKARLMVDAWTYVHAVKQQMALKKTSDLVMSHRLLCID